MMDRRAAAFGAGIALGIWIMAIAILVMSCLAPTVRAANVGTAMVGGVATWYDVGPGYYGAVPTWRYGDDPYLARVCTEDVCVFVTVRDFCACGDRAGKATVIDLSREAFADLAPLSAGVIAVTLEAAPTEFILPPTDTVAELDLFAILALVR